jgi:hypothetical protein
MERIPMRTPEFTAELSLFQSQGSYGGASAAVRSRAVLPQNLVARPPIDIPPISVNCDQRRRGCEWWCGLSYSMCIRGGEPERTCAQRYFVCSDACDLEWDRCRGLIRDPNYDPFADRFPGVP